jgi:uncharacterized protein YndB with AHSA1/START domain
MATVVNVSVQVNASVEKVWNAWNAPEHVVHWCFASDDWCAPHASSDLRVGGSFITRMEAKDGSFGFDFGGVFDEVVEHKRIVYHMSDGRKVEILFVANGNTTTVVENFDAETENPVEMQQQGWQMILNNFKKYAETKREIIEN